MKIPGLLIALLILTGSSYVLADDDESKGDQSTQAGAKVEVDAPKSDKDLDAKPIKRTHKHIVKEEDDNVNVRAPFVKVHQDEDGHIHVRAPFTHVDTDENGHTKVRAPFTKVDQ